MAPSQECWDLPLLLQMEALGTFLLSLSHVLKAELSEVQFPIFPL
jgi:hypothetical protein